MGARLEKPEQTVLDNVSLDLVQVYRRLCFKRLEMAIASAKANELGKTTKSMRMHEQFKPQESM